MKWIKASERLPELVKDYVNIKWVTKSYIHNGDCISFTGSHFNKDRNGIYFYFDADDTLYLHECKEVYWLDETPEDWDLLEKQFNEDFNTLTDKPTTGYDVIQWIKKKLRATN